MLISEIIDICVSISQQLILFASTVIDIMTSSVSDLLVVANSLAPQLVPDIVVNAISNTAFGQSTLMFVMLSSGISLYLIYQLVTWILNIIT